MHVTDFDPGILSNLWLDPEIPPLMAALVCVGVVLAVGGSYGLYYLSKWRDRR